MKFIAFIRSDWHYKLPQSPALIGALGVLHSCILWVSLLCQVHETWVGWWIRSYQHVKRKVHFECQMWWTSLKMLRWPPVLGNQEKGQRLVGLLLHSLDSSLMPCSIAGETPIIVHMLFNYCFNRQLREKSSQCQHRFLGEMNGEK